MQRNHVFALALATALGGGIAGYALRGNSETNTAPTTTAPEEAHDGEEHGGENSQVVATPEQIKAAAIEVAPVTATPLTGEVIASGQIVPATQGQAHVTARTDGVVVRLLRQLGDPVTAGTPLAILDSRDIADAQARYLQAGRTYELARASFAREETLWQQKVTARADYDQAKAALDAARIDRDLAAQQLRALGIPADRIGRASDLRLIEVRAPVAGRVTQVNVTPGEYVSADKELFQVANQRVVWAELLVPARDLPRVRQGQRVEITPQGEAHAHVGRIQFLSPAIDPASGAAKAVVTLPNPDGELAIGRLVTGHIATARDGRSGIMVPKSALQEVGGRTVVFVRNQRGFEVRPLTVAPGTSERVTVLAGLKPGERIAVENSFILKAELGKSEAEHEH